jgi:hypothetical protein
MNLIKKETIFESLILNHLIPIRVEIKDIRIVITDKITTDEERKIALNISKILSYGVNEKNEAVIAINDKDLTMRRLFKVTKLYVNIVKENELKNEVEVGDTTNCFIHPFNFDVTMEIPRKKNITSFRKIPMIGLSVKLETSLIFDLSISRLNFLTSFFNYLSKIKTVEKYWIHRPDIRDEQMSVTTAKEWLKYAFRIIKEEVKRKKRQMHDLSSLIEKIIYMERYIQLYKASNKLIIAPWIKYTDCEEDLQALENKMTLDDIIYCREIAFTELITEGKSFCASGEIGEGYKPLIHIWEYYVNDLKSKWMNKTENSNQIGLSNAERRDLMMLANLDKDKVLLSYLKGEPNHPEDIMSHISLEIPVIIINFTRKASYEEVKNQLGFFKNIYSNILPERLKNTKLVKYLSRLSREDLRSIVLEEDKQLDKLNASISEDNEDEYDEDNIYNSMRGAANNNINNNINNIQIQHTDTNEDNNLLMNNDYRGSFEIKSPKHRESSKVLETSLSPDKSLKIELRKINDYEDTDSKIYIDEIAIEDQNEIIPDHTDKLHFNRNSPKYGNRKSSALFNKITKKKTEEIVINFRTKVRKTLFSIVIGNINTSLMEYRNAKLTVMLDILLFKILDHNLTYNLVNNNDPIENLKKSNKNFENHVKVVYDLLFVENDHKVYNLFLDNHPYMQLPMTMKNIYKVGIIKLLVDIVKNQKILNSILDDEFEMERFYIREFIYRNNFKMMDLNVSALKLEEQYHTLLIPILQEKGVLKDNNDFLPQELYRESVKKGSPQLLNNRKFISKVFDTAIRNKQKRHESSLRLTIKQSFKPGENHEDIIRDKIKKAMVSDLNYIMTEVCMNLIRYILSSIYQYYINDKTIFKLYRTMLKETTEKIPQIKDKDKFLRLLLVKEGREYPNYIIKDFEKPIDEKLHVDNDEILYIENQFQASLMRLGTEFWNKEQEDQSRSLLNIKLLEDTNFDICNETLSELICKASSISKTNKKKITFAGNIIADIKKSYLDIYDDFKKLKTKWQAISVIDKLVKDAKESLEMKYLKSNEEYVTEKIIKQKMLIKLKVASLHFNIYDKLFYIMYEKNVNCSLNISHLSISNSRLDRLPILRTQQGMFNVNNNKNFDFDTVCKFIFETKLAIKDINVKVDNDIIFQTDFEGSIYEPVLPDIPFLSDQILVFNSRCVKLNISPSLIKMLKLVSNLSAFENLYLKEFNIVNKPKTLEKKLNHNKVQTSSIICNFQKKLQKYLTKLLDDPKSASLVSYLKNRIKTQVYYTVGDIRSDRGNQSQSEVFGETGFFIRFIEIDNGIKKLTRTDLKNLQSHNITSRHLSVDQSIISGDNPFLNNECLKTQDAVENENEIFTIHLPLVIFNHKDSLFYRENQLWLSNVNTYKSEILENDKFEKIKIKFNKEEKFKLTSMDLLFCHSLIKSTQFFKNKREFKHIGDMNFTSPDFPFDNSFSIPSDIGLNSTYHQRSYKYEYEIGLRKIYRKMFGDNNNIENLNDSQGKNDILSFLNISINKLSLQFFLNHHSQFINFFSNIQLHLSLYEKLKEFKYFFPADLNENKRAENKYNEENERLKPFETLPKFSTHKIKVNVKNIKIKIFYEAVNSQKNLMIFFTINNILYLENINNVIDVANNVVSLSHMEIDSIGLTLSIPNYFRAEDIQDRIIVLNEERIKDLHEKMKQFENQLLVLALEKIKINVMKQESIQLVLNVSDAIKFGFAKREGLKVKSHKSGHVDIDPILLIEKETKNIPDARRTKLKDKLFELDLNNNFDYSLMITIKPKVSSNQPVKSELFYSLSKISAILNSVLSMKDEYKVDINVNLVFIEIPSVIFYYIYYLKNYVKEIESFLDTYYNIERDDNNKTVIIKDMHRSRRVSSYGRSFGNFIQKYKELADSKFELLSFYVPYISLSLKQLLSQSVKTVFLELGFIHVKGKFHITSAINRDNYIDLSVNNIQWEPYMCRYDNLLVKKEDCTGDVLSAIIKFPKPKSSENESSLVSPFGKDKVFLFDSKTKSLGHIFDTKLKVELVDCYWIFLGKCIKEIVCFVDQNTECLKENPHENDRKLLTDKEDLTFNLRLLLKNCSIVLPESSNSANFILINAREAIIFFGKSNEIPKLIVQPSEKVHIIENKNIFNIKPVVPKPQPETSQTIPHAVINIDAKNLEMIFNIDDQQDKFAKIDDLRLVIKSPKGEDNATQLRKIDWVKEFGAKVVTCKPSLAIRISDGKIETQMVTFFNF